MAPYGEYLGGEPVSIVNPHDPEEAVVIVEHLIPAENRAEFLLFDGFSLRVGPDCASAVAPPGSSRISHQFPLGLSLAVARGKRGNFVSVPDLAAAEQPPQNRRRHIRCGDRHENQHEEYRLRQNSKFVMKKAIQPPMNPDKRG